MATRTWNGATADWTTDADWTPATPGNGVPGPGDAAVIASGTVVLTANLGPHAAFDNNALTLGGATGATLLLRNDAPLGNGFNVAIAGTATIEADGLRSLSGSITGAPNDGSTITLKADPGGNLVLLNGGTFNVADRVVDFEGTVTLERDARVSGNIVNNGTLDIVSGTTTFASNSVTGTGTVIVGSNAAFFSSPLPASQTVAFSGTGGTIGLDYQNAGAYGTITNFAPGDFIRFTGFGPVTSAALDTAANTLTINDSTGRSYVYNNVHGAAGALSSIQLPSGFSQIGYASAAPVLDYQVGASARAINAGAANGMTLPGTATPITGAGVKVGIISTSFNLLGGASADVAAGYLPAAGVTVLREGPAGSDDEGRAMAQLVHQAAPGASLYFAGTGPDVSAFAASVQALQAAGCTVIVDDIGLGGEPFFQLGSPAEAAIAAAVAAGVTYVTSTGNIGSAYYEHAFTPTPQTLLDGSAVQAMTFANGTPYQGITAKGGSSDTIRLQWDAPYYGTGGVASDQPGSVTFKVFDAATNALVGTSQQVSQDGHLVAATEFTLPFKSSDTPYRIAIYQTPGTPAPTLVKYTLLGIAGGLGVGGRINDPDAGTGSGAITGHPLIPGVIAVGAADVNNAAAFGPSLGLNDYFSSSGPGTLLFDADGNRLPQPVTPGSPDVTGPDGSNTSVPGFAPFFGTSAAAPSVAGVAALLQQVNPALSPASISSILVQSSLPLTGASAVTAGAGLVQADRAVALAEQVACYCVGTMILTASGERPVEALAIGEGVVTASGALRPIRWIGRRSYARRFLRGRPHLLPVRFAAGSLGDGVPRRDLSVSPQHAMLLDGMLVPAVLLVNGTSILQADGKGQVEYVHLELDSHDAVLAEGAPSETFVDDGSRGMFHNAAEYHALYPGAPVVPPRYCAPRVEDGAELEAVRARLRALACGARAPRGPLSGFVDEVTGSVVRGWARDAADPDHPVWLQVFDNGMAVAMACADQDRPDVRQAGIGDGRCGYAMEVPGGFAPGVAHRIEVRRATDGAPLGEFSLPAVPGAAAPPPRRGTLDQAGRQCVAGWAQDPADPGAAVVLDILCNGARIGQVCANRFRPDLLAAGVGDGRHGFLFAMPPTPPGELVIEVRHVRDGGALAGSPAVAGPAQAPGPGLEQAVEAAVSGLEDAGSQAQMLSFMLAQADRLVQRQADAQAARWGRDQVRQFRRRWGLAADADAGPPEPALRALVIDETLPAAGRDAGSNAILSHMRALQTLGYAVSVVAAGELQPPGHAAAAIEALGVTPCVAPLYASVEDVLRRQAGCFDLVYLHRAVIAGRYLALARAHQPQARIVYSVADLHHVRLERQAAAEGRPELLLASRRVRLEEYAAAWMADAVITHSAAEAALLRRAVPEASVHQVAWHVPAQPTPTPWASRHGVAFVGSYGHAPNTDAAAWLAEAVMPLVWQQEPGITCLLAGSGMPPAVRALARPGITVLGQVDDLAASVFGRVRLTVAPLRYGAGLKGKVLDSLAAGVPCVMTGAAAEGMGLPAALQPLVGRDAPALAALVCRLHRDEAAHRALAEAGLLWIGRTFDAATVADALHAVVEGRAPRQEALRG